MDQISQINVNLRLDSKEVFSLQELMEIINFFHLNKYDQIKNITNVIQFFSKEIILINDGKEEEAINELINLYNFLKEKAEDKEDFPKLMASIFKNEYKKFKKIPCQLKLWNLILEDKNIIYNSYQLIKKQILYISSVTRRLELFIWLQAK